MSFHYRTFRKGGLGMGRGYFSSQLELFHIHDKRIRMLAFDYSFATSGAGFAAGFFATAFFVAGFATDLTAGTGFATGAFAP